MFGPRPQVPAVVLRSSTVPTSTVVPRGPFAAFLLHRHSSQTAEERQRAAASGRSHPERARRHGAASDAEYHRAAIRRRRLRSQDRRQRCVRYPQCHAGRPSPEPRLGPRRANRRLRRGPRLRRVPGEAVQGRVPGGPRKREQLRLDWERAPATRLRPSSRPAIPAWKSATRPSPRRRARSGTLFRSFFTGRVRVFDPPATDGRRLDLVAATEHDRFAPPTTSGCAAAGILTAREGIRLAPDRGAAAAVRLLERPSRSSRPRREVGHRRGLGPVPLRLAGPPRPVEPCLLESFGELARAFAAWLAREGCAVELLPSR